MTWKNRSKNLDKKIITFQSGKVIKYQNNNIMIAGYSSPLWNGKTKENAGVWTLKSKS